MVSQPWGLSGPQFLGVYAAAFAVSLLVVAGVRARLRRGPAKVSTVDVYTLAVLNGGRDRVVDVAHHHPWLAAALGPRYAAAFAHYAGERPLRAGRTGHADAEAFEAHLADRGELPRRPRRRWRLRPAGAASAAGP